MAVLHGWINTRVENFTDPVHSISRPAQMGPLWMEAAHLSGMPIQNKIWAFDAPASSYPACIAVKCAQQQSHAAGEYYLRKLREAVMIDGKNIANQNILIHLAEELSANFPSVLNVQQFIADIKNDAGIEKLREDLDEVRAKNIKRFPSLVFRRHGHEPLILQGYRPFVVWQDLMTKLAPDIKRKEISDAEAYRSYWPKPAGKGSAGVAYKGSQPSQIIIQNFTVKVAQIILRF